MQPYDGACRKGCATSWLVGYCMHALHARAAHIRPPPASPGRWLQQDFDRLLRVMAVFVGVTIPAALVNSGLKYMQASGGGLGWAGLVHQSKREERWGAGCKAAAV